jgi:hypothetical protein
MAIGTNFSIDGDAKVTAGYDIDDEQFGFKNEANAGISIGLVFCEEETDGDANEDGMIGGAKGKCTASNADKVGMSGWVGSIKLKDFRIILDSDHDSFKNDDGKHTYALYTETDERYAGTNPYTDGSDGIAWPPLREETRTHTGLYIIKPSIEAKLKNGPLWVQIFGAPSNEADLIAHVEDDIKNDRLAESHDRKRDVATDLSGMGIKAGYTTDDLDFSVGLTSDYPFDSDIPENGRLDNPGTKIIKEQYTKRDGSANGTPVGSSMVLSAGVGVNVGPAKLDLQVVQGLMDADDRHADADDTGVGAKLKTDFGDVTLEAGADIRITGDEDIASTAGVNEAMDWEVGGTATVTLTESTSLESNFIHSTNNRAATDLEVILSDSSGLVEDLSMNVRWGLFDITGGSDAEGAAMDIDDQMDMFVEADLSYAIHLDDMDDMGDEEMMMKGRTITPGTKLTINQLNDLDPTVGLELRAILENAIPATTFELKWATKQLLDTEAGDAQQGTITLSTKIVY